MTTQHRAPLTAFLAVAVVCCALLFTTGVLGWLAPAALPSPVTRAIDMIPGVDVAADAVPAAQVLGGEEIAKAPKRHVHPVRHRVTHRIHRIHRTVRHAHPAHHAAHHTAHPHNVAVRRGNHAGHAVVHPKRHATKHTRAKHGKRSALGWGRFPGPGSFNGGPTHGKGHAKAHHATKPHPKKSHAKKSHAKKSHAKKAHRAAVRNAKKAHHATKAHRKHHAKAHHAKPHRKHHGKAHHAKPHHHARAHRAHGRHGRDHRRGGFAWGHRH